MKDEGSGFAADPVDPLLQSSDPNFRPVDIEFGPDGSLYLCDWYNPLVGHMQHSIRDPNRDHTHGRIWRVHYTKRPLVKPAKIAGAADRGAARPAARPSRKSGRTTACAASCGTGRRDEVIGEVEQVAGRLAEERSAVRASQARSALAAPGPRRGQRAAAQGRAPLARLPGPGRGDARALLLARPRREAAGPLAAASDRRASPRAPGSGAGLSFFNSQEAIDVAVESLVFDQDDYLKYTFNETMKTLERRVKGQTSLPHEGTDWDKRNAEGIASRRRTGEGEGRIADRRIARMAATR